MELRDSNAPHLSVRLDGQGLSLQSLQTLDYAAITGPVLADEALELCVHHAEIYTPVGETRISVSFTDFSVLCRPGR